MLTQSGTLYIFSETVKDIKIGNPGKIKILVASATVSTSVLKLFSLTVQQLVLSPFSQVVSATRFVDIFSGCFSNTFYRYFLRIGIVKSRDIN